MTRLSAKLFRDFEPGGGLCYILVAAIKYKLARPGFNFEKDLAKADRAAVSAPPAPRRPGRDPARRPSARGAASIAPQSRGPAPRRGSPRTAWAEPAAAPSPPPRR